MYCLSTYFMLQYARQECITVPLSQYQDQNGDSTGHYTVVGSLFFEAIRQKSNKIRRKARSSSITPKNLKAPWRTLQKAYMVSCLEYFAKWLGSGEEQGGVLYSEAGILKNYVATTLGLSEIELRFCPWLILYKYRTGWPGLSSSFGPYYMYMHRGVRPRVSFRCQDLRLNTVHIHRLKISHQSN